MLAPEVETRPWAEQLASTTRLPRAARLPVRALAVLPREARRGGLRRRAAAGGLAEIAQLPLTESSELRATATAEQPDRRAPRAPTPAEIVRIYSTSGTTGTPSYIPLTARRPRQLGRPARRAATRPPASPPASGSSRTYNAGPFVAGRGARRLRPHRPLPHPGRHRQHRAARCARSSCCGPRPPCSRPPTPPTSSSGRPSAASTCAARASSASSWPASPAAASRPSAPKLEEGWGARVTEAMGIGDIGVSLWGECEQQDGMHLGARGFVHAELIDPETGERARARRRRHRRARPHPPPPPRRAAAALPHPRPRRGPDEPVPVRAHRPARALHRAHRRHADRARRQRLPLGGARGRERVRAATSAATSSCGRRRPGVKQEPPLPVERRARARRDAPMPRSPRRSARGCATCSSSRRASSSCRGAALQRSEYKSKLVER